MADEAARRALHGGEGVHAAVNGLLHVPLKLGSGLLRIIACQRLKRHGGHVGLRRVAGVGPAAVVKLCVEKVLYQRFARYGALHAAGGLGKLILAAVQRKKRVYHAAETLLFNIVHIVQRGCEVVPGEVGRVHADGGQGENEAGVIRGLTGAEAAALVGVGGDIVLDGLEVFLGHIAPAARQTEDQPLASEGRERIVLIVQNIVAGDGIDIQRLLPRLDELGISALRLEERVAVGDAALVGETERVIRRARRGDLISACGGADGIDELYHVLNGRGLCHAGDLRVIVSIEEGDVRVVSDVIARHDDVGDAAVDGVHPAGVFAPVLIAERRAVGPRDAGDEAAAGCAVAVFGKRAGEHVVHRRAVGKVVVFRAEPHAAVIAEREAGAQTLVNGLVRAGRGAGDGQGDGYGLLIEKLELFIVGVLLGILAVYLAGEPARHSDGLVLLIARDKKVFMAYDLGVAGLEGAPLFRGLPAVHRHGHYALPGHGGVVIRPHDGVAVALRRLKEGVQVRGYIAGVGVRVLYAVKIVRLDKRHQRDLPVDIGRIQRLDGDGDIARGADAGRLVGDGDSQRHVNGLFARQGADHRHARGVVDVGRDDDALVAAGDGDGLILAVHAEVGRRREADVVDDVAGIKRIAGDDVAQTGGAQPRVQLLLQLVLEDLVGVSLAALDNDGEGLFIADVVHAVAHERGRESDTLIKAFGAYRYGVGRGVAPCRGRADLYELFVGRGPRHGIPDVKHRIVIAALAGIGVLLRRMLIQRDRVAYLRRHRQAPGGGFELRPDPVAVPAESGAQTLFHGCALAAENKGHVKGNGAAGHRGIEVVAYLPVRRDGGKIAAVMRGLLHGDLYASEVLILKKLVNGGAGVLIRVVVGGEAAGEAVHGLRQIVLCLRGLGGIDRDGIFARLGLIGGRVGHGHGELHNGAAGGWELCDLRRAAGDIHKAGRAFIFRRPARAGCGKRKRSCALYGVKLLYRGGNGRERLVEGRFLPHGIDGVCLTVVIIPAVILAVYGGDSSCGVR